MDTTTLIILAGLALLVFTLVGLPKILFYKKKFALTRRGTKRLELRWRADYEKVFVKLDGNEIGTLALTKKEAMNFGKSVILPDGSTLRIKFGFKPSNLAVVNVIAPEVTVNDVQLPGSVNDPELELNVASNYFILGGVLNGILGLLGIAIADGQDAALNILMILFGLVAIITGIFIRRRSRTALSIGIGIAVFDALISAIVFLASLSAGGGVCSGLFDFAGTVMFVAGLRKGFKSMDQLDKELQDSSAPTSSPQ